jgi:exopolysaccharide biosynthesis polyprenyl glycosylphosphotransferase
MIRLFRALIPSNVLALLVSETALVYTCYLLAAYWKLQFSADIFLWNDRGLWRIAIVCLLIIVGLHFHDLYDSYRIRSRIVLIQQFCFVLGLAFLLQALLSYGRWDIILPKWHMLYGSALVLVVVPAWRIIFSSTVAKALGSQKLLFVGSSDAVREIGAQLAERPELGMVAVGYVDDGTAHKGLPGIPRLGSIEELNQILASERPDRVVVAVSDRRGFMPLEKLLALRFAGMPIEEVSNTYETVFHRVSTRDLRPSQLIFSPDIGPQESKMILQSIYSWLIGAVGLMIASPVMLVVGILVKFTSAGPVFFRQTRVGLNGKLFTLYKFRSMRQDAEAETGAVWAARNDPRATPLGRWLRKLRLDELPQLFNVVRGEMSIVGPRPERPEFVEELQHKIPYYRQRLCVKPGITGWAQVNHKYGDTIDDAVVKLEYDLYYIKHLSMALDLFVMFHTLKTVLTGRGAQ